MLKSLNKREFLNKLLNILYAFVFINMYVFEREDNNISNIKLFFFNPNDCLDLSKLFKNF